VKHFQVVAALAISIVISVNPSVAKVVKFEILRVEAPAFEGRIFGKVGTYDRIIARATIAVAPDDPHNSTIADIDRAPRNSSGLVEAVSDVEILRPTVVANGNRRLFYEVLNRGGKLGLALFNDNNVVNDVIKAGDAGNGFLMNRGFTIVWSGWQGDIAAGAGRLTFSPPTVLQVTGLAREEFVFDHLENPAPAPLSYPAISTLHTRSCRYASERRIRARRRPTFHLNLRGQTASLSTDQQDLTRERSTSSSISPKTPR
jgi:hypothetical protein